MPNYPVRPKAKRAMSGSVKKPKAKPGETLTQYQARLKKIGYKPPSKNMRKK
jgi:hypothetical protein